MKSDREKFSCGRLKYKTDFFLFLDPLPPLKNNHGSAADVSDGPCDITL
jgi:hypothetical protein